MDVSLVYMVAGLSSRFGGRIKQFAKVGMNGETFIEVSLNQAINASNDYSLSKIIFVVGEKTEKPFKDKFGDNYNGIPVFYAKQTYNPESRDGPWGTADAACSALHLIKEPCVICNGDDLYGEKSFRKVIKCLCNSDENVTIGIELKEMIPNNGAVTRGIFKIKDNYLESAEEVEGITKENFKEKVSYECLCNMNLFGLRPNVVKKLCQKVKKFRETYKSERRKECYIHVELANVLKENNEKMKIYPMTEKWLGITNPGDEVAVRKALCKN